MRSALLAVLLVAVSLPGLARGQAVLRAATQLGDAVQEPILVLRPEPALREFSKQVANVLELRTGATVDVGAPPPPGLLEAVPAGHVALAIRGGHVVLVVGTRGGTSIEAHLPGAADVESLDTRAVALALEALRDAALDRESRLSEPDQNASKFEVPGDPLTEVVPAAETGPGDLGPSYGLEEPPLSDEGWTDTAPHRYRQPNFLEDVRPFAFVRSYSGASSASRFLEAGLSSGAGLCSVGQCLMLVTELPLTSASTQDLRYRYVTFSSSFYSRPFRFGRWTPGASVGFLTRIGRFEADMGLPDGGLDTDLAVRGSLELAYALMDYVDVMAEAGADIALDRMHRSQGRVDLRRGERVSPWMQIALRLRTKGQ